MMSFVTLVVGKIKQHAAHVFLTACFSNVPSVDTHELGDLALPERLHLQIHMQIPASVKLKRILGAVPSQCMYGVVRFLGSLVYLCETLLHLLVGLAALLRWFLGNPSAGKR